MVEISTSILNIEKEKALQTFYNLEIAGTNYYHIDVMDGKFVEKDTRELMLEYSNTIKQISNIPIDVHFMVENVKENIDEYLALEPEIITFHYEACKNKKEVYELIKYIKEHNIKPGLSIKPNTEAQEIYEFLQYIHLCLVMTVEPGKGGQQLIPQTVEKVKEIKNYIDANKLNTYIEVDGGINNETATSVKKAGAEILVAGSSIIKAENFKNAIEELIIN